MIFTIVANVTVISIPEIILITKTEACAIELTEVFLRIP